MRPMAATPEITEEFPVRGAPIRWVRAAGRGGARRDPMVITMLLRDDPDGVLRCPAGPGDRPAVGAGAFNPRYQRGRAGGRNTRNRAVPRSAVAFRNG